MANSQCWLRAAFALRAQHGAAPLFCNGLTLLEKRHCSDHNYRCFGVTGSCGSLGGKPRFAKPQDAWE
jgi:hypothetical protein